MPQQNSEVELNPQKVGSAVKAQRERSDFLQKNQSKRNKACSDMVEMTGFEPAASASRTQRSTKLSHISILNCFIKNEFCYFSFFRAATPLTLAVPEKFSALERLNFSTAAPFRARFICRRQRSHSKLPN